MTTVVAGLFDTEADATPAMDKLLGEHINPIETRVFDPKSGDTGQTTGTFIPLIPNTSAGNTGSSFGANAGVVALGEVKGWLHDMDDVERNFYADAYREGSALVLAKVDDKDAPRVRELLSQFGARTYTRK